MASSRYRSAKGAGAGDRRPEWDNPRESSQDFRYDGLQGIEANMQNLEMTPDLPAPTDLSSLDYTLSDSLPLRNEQDPTSMYNWKGKGVDTGSSTPRQVNFASPLASSSDVIPETPQDLGVGDNYTNQPPSVDPTAYDEPGAGIGDFSTEDPDYGIRDDEDDDSSSMGRQSPEQEHQSSFYNLNQGPFSPPPGQSGSYPVPNPSYIIERIIPYSPGHLGSPPPLYSYNPSSSFPIGPTSHFGPYTGSGSYGWPPQPQSEPQPEPPAQGHVVDISLRISSKRDRWEESTALIDTGNDVGPLISIRKVLDLGYDHASREVSFNHCKDIATAGGSIRTLGSIDLDWRHRNPKGRSQNHRFHIWEPQMQDYYDVLFPGDFRRSRATAPAVNSLVLSKTKLTKEEKLAQRDRFIEQEEEAERYRKEREARRKKAAKAAEASSSSGSKRHDSSSSSSYKKK